MALRNLSLLVELEGRHQEWQCYQLSEWLDVYMPLRWTRDPIPAVIAIPMHPPVTTRSVGASTGDPEVFAPIMPVRIKPAMAKATMLHAAAPGVGANAPKKGIKPPMMKLAADAIDA